jgi:hypothetical protein
MPFGPIHHAPRIIGQIAQPVCELAHTTRNLWVTSAAMSYSLGKPISALSTEFRLEKLISLAS